MTRRQTEGHDALTEDEQDLLPATDQPTPRMLSWVRNSAAYRLARKMMSERELGEAIAKKAREKFEDISEAQIAALSAAAVEFGKQMRALDDVAYAEIRTRSSARSGKSKRVIARKLKDKGIDREIIDGALAETDDFIAALIFARKRAFGPFRRLDVAFDEKRHAKEFSSFARNGFSFEIGRKVMEMDRETAEDLLNDQRLV
jgi:regulatory protein